MATRTPAPSPLRLVQDLVNTADLEERTDLLATPSAAGEWLRDRALVDSAEPLSGVDHRRLLDVREGLRSLLLVNNGHPAAAESVAAMDRALAGVRLRPVVWGGVIALHPAADGIDAVLGRLLATVVEATVDGSWYRLKACPDHHCHYAFYDHSKNGSGVWCAMSPCGNRAKARSYRARRRAPLSSEA